MINREKYKNFCTMCGKWARLKYREETNGTVVLRSMVCYECMAKGKDQFVNEFINSCDSNKGVKTTNWVKERRKNEKNINNSDYGNVFLWLCFSL